MFRDDVPGCGVYRHTEGKLVKQCTTLAELLHGEFYSSPPDLETFLEDAHYAPYETVENVYTVYAPIEGARLESPFREAFDGVRYLIRVHTDPKAQFFVLVADSLLAYLEVLELLQPLAMHKRMVTQNH